MAFKIEMPSSSTINTELLPAEHSSLLSKKETSPYTGRKEMRSSRKAFMKHMQGSRSTMPPSSSKRQKRFMRKKISGMLKKGSKNSKLKRVKKWGSTYG